MAANNALQLTSIDFDNIKNDLKSFLSNQTELGDYNYESSTMQILLNLLAYNTYKNSFYLNMVGNEMFLDSAQIRSNVVSRAKMLGYTPRSITSPTATVKVTITPNDSPSTITIDANTRFSTTVDGVNYVYTNPTSLVINANSQGVYSGNLTIVEGEPLVHRFQVSSQNPVRYIIPNDNVDTTLLAVKVQESSSNTSTTTWVQATDLTSVTANSAVYYLSESEQGRYEIKFGDNILGKQVNDGNIVIVGYRVSTGDASQDASTFTTTSQLGGYTSYALSTVSRASQGAPRETIDSIKFNAPRSFQTQNRAVTISDYKSIISNYFTDFQAVAVWGGEENDPPTYGKVFISVKPRNGLYISDNRKNDVRTFLKDKTVLSIDTEIIDSTYLYVRPALTIKYNPDNTSQSATQIANSVRDKLIAYELNDLNLFGNEYINSDVTAAADSVDTAINSVRVTVLMEKDFKPITTALSSYKIAFNNKIYNPHMGHKYAISSSAFIYNGKECRFDDDGNKTLRVYTLGASNSRVYLNNNAGSVDYNTGRINIDNILITAYDGDGVTILADPDIEDIKPQRNQMILLRNARVDVYNSQTGNLAASAAGISTLGSSLTTAALNSQSASVGLYSTVY